MANNSMAAYTSHDASLSFRIGDTYRTFEVERITGNRYDFLWKQFEENPGCANVLGKIRDCLISEFGEIKFDVCYTNQLPQAKQGLVSEIFGVREFQDVPHHSAHAASSFFTSPFEEALVISYDGGGDDLVGISFFNVFHACGTKIEKLASFPYDLGTAYLCMGWPLSEIRKSGSGLSMPGKLMGLCAYGDPLFDLEAHLAGFFRSNGQDKRMLQNLGKKAGFDFHVDALEGKISYDVAATTQSTFEGAVFESIDPIIEKHRGLPICLAGGCALNVLTNEKIRLKHGVPVYVPPSPNDCGLSLGMLLLKNPPKRREIPAYLGPNLFDLGDLSAQATARGAREADIGTVAELIAAGKIVGIARGRAECGPRALGNRSIVCDPGIPDMKDTLNARVKYREWFRPFAPFVRKEDCGKYFEFDGDSPFMSFAAPVREEWRTSLGAVTHCDGTARIQTVTRESHKYFYDLLGEFNRLTGKRVLLNTSFNIKGKPILNTVKEALDVLRDTQIDAVVVEDKLFVKDMGKL